MAAERLPDILGPDLDVVFVGTSAGTDSAKRGHYYSNGGNRFYQWIHEVGFTPAQLEPTDDHLLPQFGIGLTDLSKTYAGMDGGDGQSGSFDCLGLVERLTPHKPKVVVFTGKHGVNKAFKHFIGHRGKVWFGEQKWTVGGSRVFIVPSSSGANCSPKPVVDTSNRARIPIDYWRELAAISDRG